MALYPEEIPGFNLHMSFQSNLAFLVALFLLMCSLAWALRDHRRRLLELATEEQEDRLYLTVLGILFVVCMIGSYFAFNKTKIDESGKLATSNIFLDEISKSFERFQEKSKAMRETGPPYAPDLPVRMPIPLPAQLDQQIEDFSREPQEEYSGFALMGMMLIVLFSVWYFYPKKKYEMQPPRPYMDNVGVGQPNAQGQPNSAPGAT